MGRKAMRSYWFESWERRWLCEGSLIVRVQRRRRVVLDGRLKGWLVGIGLVIWVGRVLTL